MPAKRIPQLDILTGATSATDDKVVIYDATADATKAITRQELGKGIVGDLPYTPSGGISATTVPAAIAELDTEAAKSAALAANSGSSLVGYTQGGTGASNRTVQAKLRETVSVKDFGAVGDGVTDDTAAIRLAIAYVQSVTMSGNSGIYGAGSYVGTAPILLFPKGVYKVTDYLTADTAQAMNYQWFIGEQAIIVADAGVTVFGGVGYDNTFEGFIFRDGACAISIKTNNVDSTKINIFNCEFHNQTTACIQTDSSSNSTILNIGYSKFKMTEAAGGYIGKFLTGDQIYFFNNWVSCYSQVAFYSGGTLNLRECLGVPGGALSAVGGRWVDNYNATIIDNFRFGGEAGGATVVRNYADMDVTNPVIPTKIRIANCPLYVGRYVVEFYKLPNVVEFMDNAGMVDSDGFYFDSSLTDTDFARFGTYGRFNSDNNFPIDFLDSVGTIGNQKVGESVFLAALTNTGTYKATVSDRLSQSQIFGSGGWGGGWSTASTASSVYVANDYGVQTREFTATADGQYFVVYKNDYLSPTALTYGQGYTLVFTIEGITISAEHQAIQVDIGGFRANIILQKGRSIYCIPFVYLNNTGITSASFDRFQVQGYNMINGDKLQLGRHVIVVGFVGYNSDVLELRGTAAPTAYTVGTTYNQGYYKGDISYRSNVAAGGFIGDVCTTAGAPGTWKTFGAVSV